MGQSVVLYLSNTGHTQAVAGKIAATTGSKLIAIKPQQAYSASDLDWTDHDSRAITRCMVAVSDQLSRQSTMSR